MTDDKSRVCIPFILDRLALHRQQHTRPFFIGLNGIQGAGKTTLVSDLHQQLSSAPHSLRTLSVSIDDLYLTNKDQRALALANPSNPLLQHRGQPGTHDVVAAKALFRALRDRQLNVKIPSYDKSAYNGQGDRADEATWQVVNEQHESTVDVVLFEGWCVGFRPLENNELVKRWREATADVQGTDPSSNAQWSSELQARREGKLGRQALENVQVINQSLREYDELTEYACEQTVSQREKLIEVSANSTHLYTCKSSPGHSTYTTDQKRAEMPKTSTVYTGGVWSRSIICTNPKAKA